MDVSGTTNYLNVSSQFQTMHISFLAHNFPYVLKYDNMYFAIKHFSCFLSLIQVQAATGEEVSAEDLGGADLHCRLIKKYFSTKLMSF